MKRKGRTKIGEIESNLSSRLKFFRRKLISHQLIGLSTLFVITSTAFVLQALSDPNISSNQSEARNLEENLISNLQVVNLKQVIDHQPDSNRSKASARSDEESMKFPLYMRIIATIACLLIFTVGVCGNLLVPIVVIKTKYLRNSTNLFLINLAVADLLVLIICEPTVLIELHSRPETWLLGEPMCKISNFVEMSAANASIFTILAISFERYYAICEPLKAGYKCTRLRATIIICLIWLLSFIFTSPILIMAKSSKTIYIDGSLVDNCILETDPYWHRMYVFVSMFAFFCLPLIVLMLVYWLISRRLIRENLAISSTKTSLKNANESHNENCKFHQHILPSQSGLKGKGSQDLRKAASFKHSVSTFLTSRYDDDDDDDNNKQIKKTETDITMIDESKGGQSNVCRMKRPLKLIGKKSLSLDQHLTAEVSLNQLLCKGNNCNNCQQEYNRARSAHTGGSKYFVVKKSHHDTNNIKFDDNERTDYKINLDEPLKRKQSRPKQQQINLLKLIGFSSSEWLHRLVYQLFSLKERVTHRPLHTRDELNHRDSVLSESFRHSQEVDNPDGLADAIDRGLGSHNDTNSKQKPEQKVPLLPSVDTECSATNQNSAKSTNLPTTNKMNNIDSEQGQKNRGVKIFGNTARNLINGTFRLNKCPRQASVASSISISISIPTQTNSTDLPSESSVYLMPNADIPIMGNNQDHVMCCDTSSNSSSPDSLLEHKRRQNPKKSEHHQPIASTNNSSYEDDDLNEAKENENSSSSSSLVQHHHHQQQQHHVHFSDKKVIDQSVFDRSLGRIRSNHLLMAETASSQFSSNCDNTNNHLGEIDQHNDCNTEIMHKISARKSKGSEQTISDNLFDKKNNSLNLNQSNHHHHHQFRLNFSKKLPYWVKRKSDPIICNHHQFKKNKTQSTKLLVVQDISKKQQMDSRRQVVIMLAFVVAAFFLLLFPYRIFTIWLLSSTEHQVQSLGMETYYNLTYFCRILIYLHSAINPIAYNLISIKFRRAFMSILLCHGSSTRRNFTTTKTRQHKILNFEDKSINLISDQKKTIIPKKNSIAKTIEF